MACCWSSIGVEGARQVGGFGTGRGGSDSLFAVSREDGLGGVFHAGDRAKSESFDPECGGQRMRAVTTPAANMAVRVR